jgi:hypothetical protein
MRGSISERQTATSSSCVMTRAADTSIDGPPLVWDSVPDEMDQSASGLVGWLSAPALRSAFCGSLA